MDTPSYITDFFPDAVKVETSAYEEHWTTNGVVVLKAEAWQVINSHRIPWSVDVSPPSYELPFFENRIEYKVPGSQVRVMQRDDTLAAFTKDGMMDIRIGNLLDSLWGREIRTFFKRYDSDVILGHFLEEETVDAVADFFDVRNIEASKFAFCALARDSSVSHPDELGGYSYFRPSELASTRLDTAPIFGVIPRGGGQMVLDQMMSMPEAFGGLIFKSALPDHGDLVKMER